MFKEIVEYENVLEHIIETNLNENQTNLLINLLENNLDLPADSIIEIVGNIQSGEKIIMDGGVEYSFDPILNESEGVNLITVALPLITKHIPEQVINHLTEKHAVSIVNSILEVEFDEEDTVITLQNKINEMFEAGDISIPVQGLRKEPTTLEIMTHGVFAPMLYKNIQFGKKFHKKPIESHCKNKSTLKDALKSYKMVDGETPLMKLLPKFIITMKDLLGKKAS